MSDMNSPSSPSSTGDEYPPLLHDNNDGDAVVVKQRQQGEDKQLNWTFLSLCAFFLLGLIWGSAFAFIKIAIDEETGLPPITVVTLRVVIGGVGMLFLLGFNSIFDPKLRAQALEHVHMNSVMHMMIMAFFNNVIPFILVAYAEMFINSGAASIINSTIPLFAFLFAHFFLRGERFSILKSIGLLIGFGGVVLVCLQKVGDGSDLSFGDFYGYILVTLSSASYAVASVYARRFMQHIPGMIASTGQILSAAVMSGMIMLFVDIGLNEDQYYYFARAGWMAWASVAYLGLISTLVAYILYFYLIRTVGSVKQTMVGFLLPVVGVFEGALLLGEWKGVSWIYITFEIVGTLLIFIGVALVSIPKFSKKSKADTTDSTGVGGINVSEGAYADGITHDADFESGYQSHAVLPVDEYPEIQVVPTAKSIEKQSLLSAAEPNGMH